MCHMYIDNTICVCYINSANTYICVCYINGANSYMYVCVYVIYK